MKSKIKSLFLILTLLSVMMLATGCDILFAAALDSVLINDPDTYEVVLDGYGNPVIVGGIYQYHYVHHSHYVHNAYHKGYHRK